MIVARYKWRNTNINTNEPRRDYPACKQLCQKWQGIGMVRAKTSVVNTQEYVIYIRYTKQREPNIWLLNGTTVLVKILSTKQALRSLR
jgi:hypothetical protein